MPATKLSKALFNPTRQQQELRKVIRICMARQEIDTQEQLASRLRMSPSQLSRRMVNGGWSAEELWRIIYELKPTDEELIRMTAFQRTASA